MTLPLKLRLERVNESTDARFQNLQRFYDRRSIAERYADGDAHLHIQLTCQRKLGPLRDEIHNAWQRVSERENGSSDVYDADVCNTLLVVQDMIDNGVLVLA